MPFDEVELKRLEAFLASDSVLSISLGGVLDK